MKAKTTAGETHYGGFVIALTATDVALQLAAGTESFTCQVGPTQVAWVGTCLEQKTALERLAQRSLASRDLRRLTEPAGSFLVLVIDRRELVVFGDVAGLHRVFYTRAGDHWLVSDRADRLAARTSAPLDDEWLALWLAWPATAVGLDATPWSSVSAAPPGGALVWKGHDPQIERYWTAPSGELSIREGAPRLANALSAAVTGRIQNSPVVSCDLSGGKDTTALASLAVTARTPTDRLVGVTLPSVSADNDDVTWARRVATELAQIEHLEVGLGECPLPLSDLDESWPTDHPSVAHLHSARHRHLASRLREAGTGAHLTGHGGDDVLEAAPAEYAKALARRPIRGWPQLRRWNALHGTKLLPTLLDGLSPHRQLPDRHHGWVARRVHERLPGPMSIGWATPPAPPPWLTTHATELAAQRLNTYATSPTRAGNGTLDSPTLARIFAGAASIRPYQQFMASQGVPAHCPYYDRAVIEAALSVRPEQRNSPTQFKPLLDTIPAIPPSLRGRRTKGHYTADVAQGVSANRYRIAAMLADGHLVEMGLVDPAAVKSACALPHPHLLALCDTLSCERWVRTVRAWAS